MLRLTPVILLVHLCTQAFALTLAEGGQARAGIVLPAEPIPAEQTAADELAGYLQKITGARFAVAGEAAAQGEPRIYVGPSAAARAILGNALVDSLGPEEFVVRVAGDDLLLVGGRPRGTLYAVYSFLEDDLGCRWTTWYDDESIPQRETLSVEGLDRREAPTMAVRDIVCHTNSTSDRELMKRFLIRNRCQGPDLRFTGDTEPYGGTSHRHALGGLWIAHTLFTWMPPETHFEAHPEYYSMAGDTRVSSRQLCFTNPGLRKALTEAVLARIGAGDPAAVYSLSAMDWTGAFCDCPDCRALVEREGTAGAPLFDYLAELGPQVKQRFPQAFISTLAYRKEQSEIPPKSIKLPDNVVIVFAPIDNNFGASMAHPSNQDTRQHLMDWPRCASHVWVWYYPNTYGPALPLGNLNRLAEDFRICRQAGVEGYFIEQDAPGVYDSRRLADLQNWLITRLMWNPDQDLDALVEDYTSRHYGAAAPMIREYIAALEQATAAQEGRMGWNAGAGQHRFLTREFVVSCQDMLDRAEAAAAGDPQSLVRVKQARMSLDLACIILWNRLSTAQGLPFSKADLLSRYRETYTQTVNARNLPGRRDALLKAMEEALGWHAVMTAPKPLPEPLETVPAERVRQFLPDGAQLHGAGPKIVADPLAAAGIAATMEPDLSPPGYAPKDLPTNVLNMGFYDAVTRRQQHAYAGRDGAIKPGEYHLYRIGRTALNSECYVWFDWSWRIQFPDVAGLYDPANPAKQWDVYASVRCEGPAYEPQSRAEGNLFYVDRVVMVEVADGE